MTLNLDTEVPTKHGSGCGEPIHKIKVICQHSMKNGGVATNWSHRPLLKTWGFEKSNHRFPFKKKEKGHGTLPAECPLKAGQI